MPYKFFVDTKNKIFKPSKKRQDKAEPVGMLERIKYSEEEDPPMQPIQGQMPDSIEEWRVALALARLGIEYEYQKNLLGGRSTKGGTVVDFWLFTAPYPTPLYVEGAYWHSGVKQYDELTKRALLKQILKGYINDIMTIDATQIKSSKIAYYRLREMIFGG